MKKRMIVTVLALGAALQGCVSTDDDYSRPVRPIGVDGQVEWNAAASQFMYAPTFGFKPVAGAAKYRFELTDAAGARHGFTAESPNAALSPIWSGVPTGACALKVVGLGPDGAELGVAGERRFIRMAPFDAAKYPKATMPYDEAARKILSYVFHRPYLRYLLENGKPDEGYPLNSYPSKMLGSQIFGLLHYARQNPSDRATALKMARLNANWLMKRAEPADSPLAYFTQTYDGRGEAGNNYVGEKFAGQHMLHYPAAAASALLAMWRETGETKYRDFAVRIADTYLKLQGEDGTWWQKMDAKTGKPVCDNRLVPTRVMPFLEEIAAVTGEEKYRAAAERAFGYIENGPMRDWCWDGQFEDIYPAPRYRNLSKYGPCDTAIYLLNRFPGDKRRLAQAREMLRFSEDQFVVWEAPHQPSWTTPVVLEQYHCYAPIDESVAKLLSTYLALYRAEGNPVDLAKAKALGDVFTRVLLPDGRLRTYWNTSRTDNEHEDWVNGQVADAFALEELAAALK